MMKKRNVAMTLLCCAGLLGLCGCGGGEESADALTATVYTDAQVGGAFVYPFTELTVSADAAENLGLTDIYNGVVFIKHHIYTGIRRQFFQFLIGLKQCKQQAFL